MKHRREILAIALPAIISNITTPVLSLVDVAITGHIGAAVYLAAIALGGTVFNTLYWLFNFLRMGTTGLTAQSYGASDSNRQSLILYRSVAVAVATGIVLLLLSPLVGSTVIRFMDADDATQTEALRYFNICIWGAPAVMLTYSLSGWFLGMQNSRAQMWMAIVTNIINIALSPVLVFVFNMGIAGVATGTLVAQWAGMTCGVAIAAIKYRPKLPCVREIFDLKSILAFFRINSDIFLRTACLIAVTLWFTHAGALQGTDTLAANSLLLQLFMLFSYFMDGFAYAGEALAGKYTGRADYKSLGSIVSTLMKIGLAFALIFTTLYALCGGFIIKMLTEDGSVISTALLYLPFAAAVPMCGFMAFIWDGILVGLVWTRAMLIAMATALIIFAVAYMVMRQSMGNNGLWLAFNLYLLTRGIVEWWIYTNIRHNIVGKC